MASCTAPALPGDAPPYERHRPEQTALYALIEEHFPRFLEHLDAEGVSLPHFVNEEFEAYLNCGRLEYGFLRVKCDACRHEKLVAFSCKRRGFCPSCGARRMAETAAHLVEHVLPEQPIRQWVLSFPYPLLLGAAVHYRIATGPHAGRKALTLRTVGSNPPADNPCIAQLSGFSLHRPPRMVQSGVGTCCRARDRDSLERLCRYIARPAVSNERLSFNDRGQVVYRLKHPFGDGTTHVMLDPIDFIARLAALVPRPHAHLTRYHGVFAPNFKHRHRIIPNPVHQSAREPHASRPAPMSWMQRLKRVFHIDIEHCGVCGGTLRVIACIETPELIEKILTHLAARNTDCIDRPRAPPLHAPQAQPPAFPSPALS